MSSHIKIYDAAMTTQLAEIRTALTAVRTEQINGDNTLNFSVLVRQGYGDYINEVNTVKLDDDFFDLAYYKPEQRGDGRLLISVECEHISYRLNNAEYDVEYFTETGEPSAILTAILAGTGFTVGTVDFSGATTFSLQAAASRRGLLVQFAAYMGGELEYSGMTISLLSQRGSATPKALTVGRDVTVIAKAVDKRNLDENGNPTVSYTVGVHKGASLDLGDAVTLDYDRLGIAVELRVVTKAYDPYNPNSMTVEVGHYVSGLEDDLYRIETEAVKKDALMNGCRIGPEYGFEAVRNDKKARAFFRSDGMKFQSGDGTGNSWKDRLYYEYDADADETTLVLDGKLSATMITALSAIITPNLYAGKATIAELTVDQLDTSDKVQKYLDGDTSDDNFQRIYDQYHELVTASTDGETTVQAANRDGQALYWADETHEAATTDATDYPVWVYQYQEQTKYSLGFYLDSESGYYIPMMLWGVGTGSTDMSGKARIAKLTDSFEISYTTSDGQDTAGVYFRDDGFVDVTARRADVSVNTTGKTITISPEGDGQSDIVIDYTESEDTLTMTWPDGKTFTVEVTA